MKHQLKQLNSITSIFANKSLLITGGTDSFGNAVLRRFLDSDIKEIRIFSRDEKIQDDMRHALQNPKVKFYIGDVRNKASVDVAMRGVDYVFAAAALKQVPSCEFFPMEATLTNVVGTNNVLLVLGVSGCVVLPLFRWLYRGRLVVNIDGLEHRREKWGRLAKWFPRLSEACAVRAADVVVADNKGIADYVTETYGRESVTIAYGGDHAVREVPESRQADLLAARGLKRGECALPVAAKRGLSIEFSGMFYRPI